MNKLLDRIESSVWTIFETIGAGITIALVVLEFVFMGVLALLFLVAPVFLSIFVIVFLFRAVGGN